MLVEEGFEALARRVVADAGGVLDRPSVVDALAARLGTSPLGTERLDDVLDSVLRGGPLLSFADGRVIDIAGPAERLILTHRLTEAEVTSSSLDLTADLGALGLLAGIDGGLHAPDGTRLRRRERRRCGAGRSGCVELTLHLDGPPGWLDALGAGTLVVARAPS